jgi:hypothetical protein
MDCRIKTDSPSRRLQSLSVRSDVRVRDRISQSDSLDISNSEFWRCEKSLRPHEIVRRQFEALGRTGQQPALGNREDSAMAVTENLQDAVITGPGFQPEVRFQSRGGDHAFDRTRPAHERKSHAPAVREYLRFEFVQGFHDYRG